MRYIFLFCYLLYVVLRSSKSIHMLQQNFYDNSNRYLKWIFHNHNKSYLTYDLLFVILLVINFINYSYLSFTFILFYFSLFVYYLNAYSNEQSKKPLVITSRVKRLIVTLLIIYGLGIYGFLIFDNIYWYVILCSLASLNSFVIWASNIINIPVEKIVYFYYFNKAKKKVKSMSRMQVVGITGSYGKTSSKNILNDILEVKFNTLPTPKSFNTPYGLMRTINDHLDKFTEIFIAEMGACEVGQIKELCNFVKPKYGILTKIGLAHLETFKTEENIQKTKFELIESLPSDGIGILNMDDEKQVSYKIKNNCKILWIAIDNKLADLYATNVKSSYKGLSFDVIFKDNKKYHLETKLLGNANIYNILASVLLASSLGMNMEDIIRGVKNIKPIEHRLELKKYGAITIIDDAYNSNPVGSKMAVETLSLMPGKKIIVTPGMIELGSKQYELNYEFGDFIAKNVDIAILVGERQTKPIYDALIKNKFKKDNLYVIDNVMEAFKIVSKIGNENTYVLLENDLPDIFNE